MDKSDFKTYLEDRKYDKKYQDIEYIDFIGYSESYKTWNAIKDLVDWKGKSVADLGCFHCYFAFKIARLGGDAVGFDENEDVLKTAEILNEAYGHIIKTAKWKGGDPILGEFDVTLCLNTLHHIKDQEKALQSIKSKRAIFEVNYDQLFFISQYFGTIRKVQSHRFGRIIILGERHEQSRG